MEFDYVGQHCQFEGCRQKDFLPFTCNSCMKNLCLAHRSTGAHNCKGTTVKDFTSIDCPICTKTIKFDKSEDPNVVWDDHFIHDCNPQSNEVRPKVQARCARNGCSTSLGLSNSFSCPKCARKVCLSHRIPEEHNCQGVDRSFFLNNVQATNNRVVKQVNTIRNDAKKKVTPRSSTEDSTNTLKGSAHRRMSKADTVATQSVVTQPTIPVLDESIGSCREVCPLCQQRFSDAIVLVQHFETAHNTVHENTASSTPSGSDRDNCSIA